MPMFVACKLPQGLEINHNGRTIVLRGQNVGFDVDNPTALGKLRGDANGFGITELNDQDAEAFTAWRNAVMFKNGKEADGKIAVPFPAFENGSIQVFKNRADAEQETNVLGDSVKSGFEGIDPDKDLPKGLSTDKDAMKGKR